MRLVAVSDVSMGFGSPQVAALVRSIRDRYEIDEAVILEPDEPDRKAAASRFRDLRLVRIHSVEHPHSVVGRTEYLSQAATFVGDLRPDILVVVTTYTLPVLFRITRRPRVVIYYQLEPVEPYGRFDVEMNHRIRGSVDIIIYPEENRAAHDVRLFGDRGVPFVVLYNCAPYDGPPPLPPRERNGRLVYYGTVEEGRTFVEYFCDERFRAVPLDIFGRVTGPNADATRARLARLDGNVRYLGSVEAHVLAQRRVAYAYSVVAWNPIDPAHWAAAPNKFFESVAAGVPPVAAPHPQCRMLIERYKLGVTVDGWSLDAFVEAVHRACGLLGTRGYEDMVANCRRASEQELNWDAQFAKLVPYLDQQLSGAAMTS